MPSLSSYLRLICTCGRELIREGRGAFNCPSCNYTANQKSKKKLRQLKNENKDL